MPGGKQIALPKGHFEPQCEDESCGSRKRRGGSIWEGAWGESGWLPVRFVSSAALDWPPSSAPWCGGRSQSVVFALSAARPNAQTKDGGSLPCGTSGPRSGIGGCQAALCTGQWHGMAWQGRLPSCRRKARLVGPVLPGGTAADRLLYLPGLRCSWLDLTHCFFIIFSPFTKYLYNSLNFQWWDQNVLSHVRPVE